MNRSPRFQLYSFKTRLLTVLVAFILCFLAVLGRVFYLQILKADYYTDKAKSQHERIVTLEPRRGRILDKNGRILAVSIQLKSLFAKPGQIDSPTRTARLLSPILDTPYHKLLIELKSKRNFVSKKYFPFFEDNALSGTSSATNLKTAMNDANNKLIAKSWK